LVTALDGLPQVDFPANLHAAMAAERRMTSILADVVSLRRGPGRLAPAEFFYFRLWEPTLTREAKRQFVGKQAQHPMHIGLAVTCVPKVPIWKMRDFSGLCCACARISLISR
jgi:hypothetical protein